MLTWDEEIKPTLQSTQAHGLFSSHLVEATPASVAISSQSCRLTATAWHVVKGKTDRNRIPQTDDCPKGVKVVCAPEFMVLGIDPNTMNRFMHSNLHEVLFVN